jgi:diaminopimelate epimerase
MLQIVRMQGLGNKFVVIRGPYHPDSAKIIELCDRKSDGGSDGVIVITPIDDSRVEMNYWNSDGSEAEMCGNGLRCAARFAVDNELVKPGEFSVNTKAGTLKAIWDGKDSKNIEVQVGKVKIINQPTLLEGKYFYIVDVGNPHAATFVGSVDDAPVTTLGPLIESNNNFPNKTNVEFIEIISTDKIKVRIWERGCGETQACGTGMVAAARLSKEIKKTNLPIIVQALGGDARVWLDNEGYCRMMAPAEYM